MIFKKKKCTFNFLLAAFKGRVHRNTKSLKIAIRNVESRSNHLVFLSEGIATIYISEHGIQFFLYRSQRVGVDFKILLIGHKICNNQFPAFEIVDQTTEVGDHADHLHLQEGRGSENIVTID